MNAEKVFEQVWREFIRRLEALRNQKPKMTYEQLGEMCGVSKVTTKRWLEGAGGEKTSFPDMLRYMQAVGMNIRAVIPQSQSEKEAVLESRLSEIQKELAICKDALKQAEKERDAYKSRWEGHLETVRAQSGNHPSGPFAHGWDRRCMPRRIFASFRQMMFRKADAVAGGTFYFLSYVKVTSFAGKVLFRSLA